MCFIHAVLGGLDCPASYMIAVRVIISALEIIRRDPARLSSPALLYTHTKV